MNLTALSTTELTLIIALAVIVFAGIAAWQGKANKEDLRQAMIHYRTLFEELGGAPDLAQAKAAS